MNLTTRLHCTRSSPWLPGLPTPRSRSDEVERDSHRVQTCGRHPGPHLTLLSSHPCTAQGVGDREQGAARGHTAARDLHHALGEVQAVRATSVTAKTTLSAAAVAASRLASGRRGKFPPAIRRPPCRVGLRLFVARLAVRSGSHNDTCGIRTHAGSSHRLGRPTP